MRINANRFHHFKRKLERNGRVFNIMRVPRTRLPPTRTESDRVRFKSEEVDFSITPAYNVSCVVKRFERGNVTLEFRQLEPLSGAESFGVNLNGNLEARGSSRLRIITQSFIKDRCYSCKWFDPQERLLSNLRMIWRIIEKTLPRTVSGSDRGAIWWGLRWGRESSNCYGDCAHRFQVGLAQSAQKDMPERFIGFWERTLVYVPNQNFKVKIRFHIDWVFEAGNSRGGYSTSSS